jgi:hypothetical protein
VNLFWSRDRRRRELEDELRSHLAMAARERVSRGERPREAEWAAKREFGNFPKVSEEVQDTWRGQFLGRLQRNMGDVVRGFAGSASITIMLAIAIALGMGAKGEVFPVIEPGRLGEVPGAADAFYDYRVINVARTNTAALFGSASANPARDALASVGSASVRLPATSAFVPGGVVFSAISVGPVHVWSTVSKLSRTSHPQ